jgi:hypothetical protein
VRCTDGGTVNGMNWSVGNSWLEEVRCTAEGTVNGMNRTVVKST